MSIYVIDQNYFRKPELISQLESNTDLNIAIPDTALIEMCKSPEWESTLRNSLLPLAPYSERCMCLVNIGDPLQFEIVNHRANDVSLIDEEFGSMLRLLMREIESSETGPAFSLFRREVPSVMEEIKNGQLNHISNLKSLSGTVRLLLESLGGPIKKALRAQPADRDLTIELVKLNMPRLMEAYLNSISFPYESRDAYIQKKSFAYRFVALRFWLSVNWIRKGGLESLPETKATNCLLDLEYVLMASYFDGFLSEDRLANEAYTDLNAILYA